MLTVADYLFALIGFGLGWYSARHIGEMMQSLLGGLFGALVGTLVGLITAGVVGATFPTHWVESETVPLASLRSTDGLSGSFVLGSGIIGTTSYYFYYEKTPDGGYQPGKVEATNRVTIYEQAGRNVGELKVFKLAFVHPSVKWFGIVPNEYSYQFFIPEGSLQKKYIVQ
ncbi:hypothetical protein FJY93_02570 [Candidatus Kaiserbacteria bacterium]|nr:hypothetical protein [Candidatus Kaiserbacteria bacterium]